MIAKSWRITSVHIRRCDSAATYHRCYRVVTKAVDVREPYYADDNVTIYHGDCRGLANLWQHADVMITDPPYGMNLRSGHKGLFGDLRIEGDETPAVRNSVLA